MSFRVLIRPIVAALWLGHIATIALLSGRDASLASNIVQLLMVLLTGVACWVVGESASEFTRRVLRLCAASCAFWAIGQSWYIYYDLATGGVLPLVSPTDLPFHAAYAPLGMAVFLYPEAEQRREWVRTLDFSQVAILLCSVYLYFFVFLAGIADSRRSFVGLGFLSVWDLLNLVVMGLFFYRAATSRFAVVRALFRPIGLVLAVYSVGDFLFSYSRVFTTAQSGSWWDLIYSLSFGVAALAVARWTDPAVGIHPDPALDVPAWWSGFFPLLAPFLVFAMSAHMLGKFPLLALAIVGASFACLALRLMLTQRRQFDAARKLQAVRDANLALTRSLDVDSVLRTLLEHLERLVPFDTANVMMLEGGKLVARATRGYEKWTTARIDGTQFDPSKIMLWSEMLKGQSMIVHDTHADPRWIVMEGTKFVRNWLAVPIVAAGEVIGFYSFDKAVPNFFTSEHTRIAESLAAQAAVAIQNARLFEEHKKSEEARAVSEMRFSRAFHASPVPLLIASVPDVRVAEINDAYLRLLGFTREEAIGRTG